MRCVTRALINAPRRHEATPQHARHNALINAVNYHHSVISSALCGKTINYHVRKTTLYRSSSPGHSFSDPFLPPVYWRKRNIARRFYSSMPFSEKRDLHLFVRFIYETLSRAHRTDLHLFIRMFTAAFQPIFRLALSLSFSRFSFYFFLRSRRSPLQKRELYGLSNETPDRYRSVSCDNSFFYHSGTTAVAWVKRCSRQHIHAT